MGFLLSLVDRVVLVHHLIDLSGDHLGELVIVSRVVAVHRDVNAAQIGGTVVCGDRAAQPGNRCMGHVHAASWESRQLRPRQLVQPDHGHALPHLLRQRFNLINKAAAVLSDAAGQQLHEVRHIGVRVRQRTFIRNGEVQQASDLAGYALRRRNDRARRSANAGSHLRTDVTPPAVCGGRNAAQ